MELLDELYHVQNLAVQKERYEDQIRQLDQSMETPVQMKKMQEEEETSLGNRKLVIFVAADIVLGFMINKGGSYLLTLKVNNGMTMKKFLDSGGVVYHNVDLIFPVGLVLALPLALLATFIISKNYNHIKNMGNQQIRLFNKKSAETNREIKIENEAIWRRNLERKRRIAELSDQQEKLLELLKRDVSWYPEAYFSVGAVDFVIHQIKEEKAASIQQAFVQYEAMGASH